MQIHANTPFVRKQTALCSRLSCNISGHDDLSISPQAILREGTGPRYLSLQWIAPWKGPLPHSCHWIRNVSPFQRTAPLEGLLPNACHWIRDSDAFQFRAACKGTIPNPCHGRRNVDVHQRATLFEGPLLNSRHWIRDSDASQFPAACKGTIPNLCHRRRNVDAYQRTAPLEGLLPNACHWIRDSDAVQFRAACKGTIPNLRHRRRNVDAHQGAAKPEGPGPNFCHWIRNKNPNYIWAIVESFFRNLLRCIRNPRLKEATVFWDVLFCTSVDFTSRVADAHFRISILSVQQACFNQCLICLSFTYCCLGIQHLYFEDRPLKRMCANKLCKKFHLQVLHSCFCRRNGKDQNIAVDGVHFQFAGHGCKWMTQNSIQGSCEKPPSDYCFIIHDPERSVTKWCPISCPWHRKQRACSSKSCG